MIKLTVPDMSCGHCVKTITEAIKVADPTATVICDVASKQVTLDSAANPVKLLQALADAGYPATV
jgi:copper chaperone